MLTYLVCCRPVRDLISETKKDSSWGTTWGCPLASTYACTHTHTEKHRMYLMHVVKSCHNYFKSFKLPQQLFESLWPAQAVRLLFVPLLNSSACDRPDVTVKTNSSVEAPHTATAQHTALYSVFCHSVSDGICNPVHSSMSCVLP